MSFAAVLEIATELGGVSILDKCLSSANLEKEQNHNNKLEESGVHGQDQWERQSHHATTSSSMAIGSLLQRVTKLVSASSPPAGSTTKAGEGEQDHGSRTSVGRGAGGDDSDDAASSPGGSAVRKPSSSSSSNDASMKRSSSELERPETRSDSRNNSKKKLPSPIKTSHLMSSNPRLSVTPATPLTSSPASLSSSSTPAAISKDTGKSRFQAAQGSASSSTSSVQGTSEEKGNNNEKINEQKQEEEGDPDNCRSEAAFLPEEQNRNSSLQSKHDDGIKTSNQLQSQTKRQEHIDEGEIVLEEPQRMTEEDEMKLSQLQERQSTATSSAHHHNEKIAHSPVKNASCEDDDHTARRGDEEPEENARDKDNAKQKDSHERWTPARQDTGESLFGSSSETSKQDDEDHPNMPRPAAPSAAPPPRNFPSKPSLLHRLPSQVISESPGSEYPPTPSSQGGGLSRQSSLGRGDRTGSGFTDITDSATFNFANPHGQAKSDENDRQNNGNQGHLPSMLATAVQDLHQKINKPTDYRFPTQSLADPPPETIAEEGPIQSPESEKENPITASPPSSSSFLDPSSHSNRYSRDSPTSSLQSASSINEYSTPAGFMKHRRSSSQNAPREVKETPNAGYKDLPDGKRKLNNYILTSDIGRGSFGLVQIAKDEETGQEYAAKEFSKMRLKKRQQSEMIRRQAKGSGRRGAVPMRARTMQSDRKSSDQNEPNKSDLDLIRE